jgi:hypothetical protein
MPKDPGEHGGKAIGGFHEGFEEPLSVVIKQGQSESLQQQGWQ